MTVLRGITEERGLRLEAYRSRAVPAGQIHELMVTDQPAEPGTIADRVGLIGFFVVEDPGVLLVGAPVRIGDTVIGTIAGFDDTHIPNHQNICLRVDELVDGLGLGVALNDPVVIGETDS
ncbi:MAG TPA: hypothetical protein VKZ96_03625 [Thermomicrobiales bacterium]|nr:hypothetical protein [Thermomicrobiales bacterium]